MKTYDGIELPPFMYGTAWKKDATAGLVEKAVNAGFKAIDTANQAKHYHEAGVGDALENLRKRGVERSSLFLQTKFTPVGGQDHRLPYDPRADLATQVRQSFESSLEHLRTDRIDSYVLHGPYARRGLSDADREVWAEMEALHRGGRTRIIGISNVMPDQLALLCSTARTRPMVVQNRCYAALGWDREVRTICRAHGIVYQGFSLLTANPEVLAHPPVQALAARKGVGPEQIVFRFAQQIGMLPLTGTTSEDHMREDLAVGQFDLSAEEVAWIESLAG